MEISSRPPSERLAKDARLLRFLTIAAALALAVSHLTALLSYDVLWLAGRKVEVAVTAASVSSSRHWVSGRHGGGHLVTVCTVGAIADPAVYLEEISCDLARDIRAGLVDRVPFLVAGPWTQVGLRPTGGMLPFILWVVFGGMFVLFALVIYVARDS
jgi:hypothetical protein